MDFTKIKKYPSQISTAFKRFPLAVAFAVLATIAFIYIFESNRLPTDSKHLHWLFHYPIAAMMIALAVPLVQESRKKISKIPQIVAGGIWLVISAALTLYLPKDHNDIGRMYVETTYILFYTTAFLSIFIGPFWKQKDENGFWVFMMKTVKAFVTAVAIAFVLHMAINLLLFGFSTLFDIKITARPYMYATIICACTAFPILFFSGIPSIDDCLEEVPVLNKFTTSTTRFLHIPVLSLYILLLYAYIAKIIIQWEMPKGMVSFLVSASMIIMLSLVTLMYPTRLNPTASFEKKLLKFFPAACIPLVILMSVGLLRRISDYGISEGRLSVVAINIFFYIIIAILLAPKIICKSRYIAIVFCAMFLIVTNGPLSAFNVTHRVWIGSIKAALAEQGFSEFPLGMESTEKFYNNLTSEDDPKDNVIASRLKVLNSRHDKELAQYIPTENSMRFVTTISGNKNNEEYIIKSYINNSKNSYFEIPKNVTQVNHFYKYFNKEDYELLNDTLFFKLKPQKLDKTFNFFVTKQALEQKDVRLLETEGAIIGVENLDITLRKEKNSYSSFSIRGLLFLE